MMILALAPPGPTSSKHVALVPQTMSATVLVLPPLHAAGPAFVAFPQSLSVTRIVAPVAIDIDSLKSMTSLSPVSRVFAKPDEEVWTGDVHRHIVRVGDLTDIRVSGRDPIAVAAVREIEIRERALLAGGDRNGADRGERGACGRAT